MVRRVKRACSKFMCGRSLGSRSDNLFIWNKCIWEQVSASSVDPYHLYPPVDQIALWMLLISSPCPFWLPALSQATPVQDNRWSHAQHQWWWFPYASPVVMAGHTHTHTTSSSDFSAYLGISYMMSPLLYNVHCQDATSYLAPLVRSTLCCL